MINTFDKNNNKKTINYQNDSIKVFYKSQIIEIKYVGLSFIKTQKNKYQYKLENLTESWIDNGTKRSVSFQGLKPGEYTFYFKGSNNDGVRGFIT